MGKSLTSSMPLEFMPCIRLECAIYAYFLERGRNICEENKFPQEERIFPFPSIIVNFWRSSEHPSDVCCTVWSIWALSRCAMIFCKSMDKIASFHIKHRGCCYWYVFVVVGLVLGEWRKRRGNWTYLLYKCNIYCCYFCMLIGRNSLCALA